MIRRFSSALIGLALCLPVFAVAPVAAHSTTGLVIDFETYEEGLNTHVVGTVANHTGIRRNTVVVTATWDGTTDLEESEPAFLTNIAPHTVTPFHISVLTATIPGDGVLDVTVSSVGGGASPAAGLAITETLTGDQVTGSVTNTHATAAATNVVVYALRTTAAGAILDTAASETIASVAAGGGSQTYTINFANTAATGGEITMYARTTSGTFMSSFNNFFNDLGGSGFVEEIAFLAEEGITVGCGGNNFCPKNSVTREQMAIFLTRALGLSNFADAGFTDIATRPQSAKDAINAIANANITGGCATNPLRFCPTSSVTRGQMSVFIIKGYDFTPVPGSPGAFNDDNGHFSEPYNNAMNAEGISTGCGGGRYCPNSNVLREQMAAFLQRAENATP